MSLMLHNTLTRKIEEFVPINADDVRLYTCGPTVYNYAHIGNFRSYIAEDLLRRYLKFSGYSITQVMNFTDVDDKTIRGSRESGKDLKSFTDVYKEAFFEDLDALQIERSEYYPAATDHVDEMIALIAKLIDKGHAYAADDGCVYYRISSFERYGQLARLNMEGMQAGARVTHDEYEKDNVADFALWKAWDEEDGDVGWESPWGRGRPGWHIECSAMSMRYLGESFDLHSGGIDNIFPHHEDEIAQSEGATGKQFVKYWFHIAHLVVEGRKMAKSSHNFYTLRDLLEKGYSGREIRYELLGTHYRQSLNFTLESLSAARAALQRIDAFTDRLKESVDEHTPVGSQPEWAAQMREKFKEAMDHDLNIAEGLAVVFETISMGNRAMDQSPLPPEQAQAVLTLFSELDRVLGFLEAPSEETPDDILEMAALRDEARSSRNWAEADRLRDEIAARGWTVKDTPDGSKVVKK